MDNLKKPPGSVRRDNLFTDDEVLNVFVEIDTDFNIVRFNNRAQECCRGISGREMHPGDNVFSFIPPNENVGFIDNIKHTMTSGEPCISDEKFRYASGSHKWFYIEIKPKKDRKGVLTGLLLLAQDISVMKVTENLLRLSHRRYNLVSKATRDIIWDWDINSDHMFRSRDEFELQDSYTSSYTWLGYIHPKDQKRVTDSVNRALYEDKSEFWEEEYRYAIAPGKYIPVQDKGYIVYNQEHQPIRMVGAMRDISLQKKQEKAMKAFSKDVEGKNKQLVEFAYILSHHTRSPLVNILSLTELLRKELHNQINEPAAQLLEALTTSTHELDNVIKVLNSICDISVDVESEIEAYDLMGLVSNLDLEKFLARQTAPSNRNR